MSDQKKPSWMDSGCVLYGAVMACPLIAAFLGGFEIVSKRILYLGFAVAMGVLIAMFYLGMHRAKGTGRLSLKQFSLMQFFVLFIGVSVEMGLIIAWLTVLTRNLMVLIFAGLTIVPGLTSLGLIFAKRRRFRLEGQARPGDERQP